MDEALSPERRWAVFQRPKWFLYAAAWTAFAAGHAALSLLTDTPSFTGAALTALQVIAPAAVLGLPAAAWAAFVEQRFPALHVRALLHALSALTYAAVWIVLVWITRLAMVWWSSDQPVFFTPPTQAVHWHLIAGIPLYATLLAAVVAFRSHRQYWDFRRRADIDLILARFDPHFLFNTLHMIRGLIKSDPPAAQEAQDLLATLLRRSLTLQERRAELVPLDQELSFCTACLDLAKLRYGNRLTVCMKIEEPARSALLPALTLQPLVENALRHGLESSPAPYELCIQASVRSGKLIIDVTNPHVLTEQARPDVAATGPQPGLGLPLVRMRLTDAVPGASLEAPLPGTPPGYFTARLSLPVIDD